MRCHVISLERSRARREILGGRLCELGVPFEFSPAIEGRAGYEWFDSCDERRYLLNTGRRPSEGEVGCYASHRRLWQLCAAGDRPFVVMEDDAAPEPCFRGALEATRELIERYGFIRLEYDGPTHPARTRCVETSGAFELHYFTRYPFGSMCYALTPAAARTLVAASAVLTGPVDVLIKRCWEHGSPLYGLLPYSVVQDARAQVTTISARVAQPSTALRLRRALYKGRSAIHRAEFNRRQLAAHEGASPR